MNVLKNILLLFVFIFVSIVIGVPGLEANNLIKSKIYLFGGVMIFQLLLKSMYKLRYKCKTDLKTLINEAIITAILSVVGFSIFIDLINMESTRDMIVPYLENKNTQSLIIASIISMFVLASKIIEIIITGQRDECEIE
jgi:membrane protease YdiL (CAAX protease family)